MLPGSQSVSRQIRQQGTERFSISSLLTTISSVELASAWFCSRGSESLWLSALLPNSSCCTSAPFIDSNPNTEFTISKQDPLLADENYWNDDIIIIQTKFLLSYLVFSEPKRRPGNQTTINYFFFFMAFPFIKKTKSKSKTADCSAVSR